MMHPCSCINNWGWACFAMLANFLTLSNFLGAICVKNTLEYTLKLTEWKCQVLKEISLVLYHWITDNNLYFENSKWPFLMTQCVFTGPASQGPMSLWVNLHFHIMCKKMTWPVFVHFLATHFSPIDFPIHSWWLCCIFHRGLCMIHLSICTYACWLGFPIKCEHVISALPNYLMHF